MKKRPKSMKCHFCKRVTRRKVKFPNLTFYVPCCLRCETK